jgi:predicted nucleic acid-binding protein
LRIHLDTNLLISRPRWELLPPGDHEFLVSALAFAEFSEGTAHSDTNIAARARIDLVLHRSTYGEGIPFTQREADVYRELCGIVARGGRTPGGRRRIDLMIAAIAIGDSAALATRNTSDFTGLESLVPIIAL